MTVGADNQEILFDIRTIVWASQRAQMMAFGVALAAAEVKPYCTKLASVIVGGLEPANEGGIADDSVDSRLRTRRRRGGIRDLRQPRGVRIRYGIEDECVGILEVERQRTSVARFVKLGNWERGIEVVAAGHSIERTVALLPDALILGARRDEAQKASAVSIGRRGVKENLLKLSPKSYGGAFANDSEKDGNRAWTAAFESLCSRGPGLGTAKGNEALGVAGRDRRRMT